MNQFLRNSRFVVGVLNLSKKMDPISSKSTRRYSNISESWKSMEGFVKCCANFEPLTPLSFLERAANVFRDRISVVYGEKLKYNWEQTHNRCVKLASAMLHLGISHGDVEKLVQEAVDTFLDNGIRGQPMRVGHNKVYKSFSDVIEGKEGRFHETLLGKQVDYSGRCVIAVGPSLSLHRCGLPCEIAIELFQTASERKLVATLAPNVPAMQELHFAVPMAGAVLCTLNTRHDSSMLAILLIHSEAKVIFVDQQLLEVARGALALIADKKQNPPLLVVIRQCDESSPAIENLNTHDLEYESLLKTGDSDFVIRWPRTEFDPISINYTSGTTSRPKGVVYSHRGAYLNTIATFLLHEMSLFPVYLWTVPMFHCNGWCLVWGLAALGGTNVCLRNVSPKDIFENISLHNVTHMGGAPTVLNKIVNSPRCDLKPLAREVKIMTGGSPPPPQVISKMEELGFRVNHLYGLTETYGPGTSCLWKPEWDSLPPDEKFILKARQGVQHLCLKEVDVRDSTTMEKVPADGKSIGEIMFKGNTVMSGYFNDAKATEEAFKGGWFHSGDLAVKHPDGYIEVKDRLKDIIISGGENISTVEVERVLYSHPAVVEAAVVARPDNHWGKTPCAFVKLKEGFSVGDQEIINFCRDNLPHYMAPRTVIFEDIPKTSTGKIQKFILREKANALGSLF